MNHITIILVFFLIIPVVYTYIINHELNQYREREEIATNKCLSAPVEYSIEDPYIVSVFQSKCSRKVFEIFFSLTL